MMNLRNGKRIMGQKTPTNASRARTGRTYKRKKDDGLREDGTPKSTGHLGKLQRTDGSGKTSTELSVLYNGRFMPSITPNQSPEHIAYLLNTKDSPDKWPEEILTKAEEYAKHRESKGMPAFFNKSDYSKKIRKDHEHPRYDDNMNKVTSKKKKK